MTYTVTKKPSLIQYSSATLKRAKRALYCSPFQLNLFIKMIKQSISLNEIALQSGQKKGYSYQEITENKAENELMWLIKVGILRREVDGQGITDSFRLTPLGRIIISETEKQGENFPKPSLWDYIINKLSRWFSWQV